MDIKEFSSKDISDSVTVNALNDEISRIKRENIKLKATLESVGLSENDVTMSDVEAICLEQIGKLKEISANSTFSKDEAAVLEILHRNLKIAQGQNEFKKINKTKNMSNDDLLRLVK